jgi:hypothetical protein
LEKTVVAFDYPRVITEPSPELVYADIFIADQYRSETAPHVMDVQSGEPMFFGFPGHVSLVTLSEIVPVPASGRLSPVVNEVFVFVRIGF